VSTDTDEIAGELVGEETRHLPAVREESTPTLFGTTDPAAVIAAATAAAAPLAEVVRKQNLAVTIQGREHVKVEGWTLLGSMLGVFPVCAWSRPILKDGKEHGWEARVEARTRNGDLVGAAEAQCTRDENQWSFAPTGRNGQTQQPRDDYALRSMAQTRATSKALRQPLGFVMQLAGFDATPAEEMPHDAEHQRVRDPHGLQGSRADAVSGEITDPGAVVLTFGKNKNKALRDVPRDYLEWWLTQNEPTNPDMQRQRRAAEMFVAGETEASPGGDPEIDIPFARTFA
jgi:hypothetical protein